MEKHSPWPNIYNYLSLLVPSIGYTQWKGREQGSPAKSAYLHPDQERGWRMYLRGHLENNQDTFKSKSFLNVTELSWSVSLLLKSSISQHCTTQQPWMDPPCTYKIKFKSLSIVFPGFSKSGPRSQLCLPGHFLLTLWLNTFHALGTPLLAIAFTQQHPPTFMFCFPFSLYFVYWLLVPSA